MKRPAAAPPQQVAPAWSAARSAAWIAALIAAYGALQYSFVFALPFVSDDYTILDKVGRTGFAALWTAAHPLWNWYRPWSRELHFWTLVRLFGVHELPFHVASFALWVGVLAAYFALVRRFAGAAAAVIAAAGAATLAAWASALSWVAGVQELWMLLFALLYLHACAGRRAAAALLALAGALLSKETAAVLPAIALLYALVLDRERPLAALRRVAPQLVMVALWAALHPFLRARLAVHAAAPGAGGGPSPVTVALRTVLSVVNLDQWPEPEIGWPGALIPALPGIVLLVAGAKWMMRRTPPPAPGASAPPARSEPGAPAAPRATPGGAPSPRAAALFAIGWAALGALPLFAPGVGWLSYYALLAALGAWAAIAVGLARRPRLALGTVAVVAALQPVHAATPSYEWASDYYQRRAAYFVGRLRQDLLARHPALPAGARLFFTRVPNGTGIGQPWFDPAFRVWYRDSTITGGFYQRYVPRRADEPPDRDYFFRCDDSAFVWVEVVKGAEDVGRERRANARWEGDHRELALLLGNAGDWKGASGEIEKLMREFPADPQYPRNLSLCLGSLGDTLGMRRQLRRADSLHAARGARDRGDTRR
jgi:hypothetical protein